MNFIANNLGPILIGLGGLGTLGIIVLIFVVGMPAAVIIANVAQVFKSFIALLKTPAGQVLGILLLCAGCLFAGYTKGTKTQAAICHEQEVRAELATVKRDLGIAKLGEAFAKQSGERLQAAVDDMEKTIAGYERDLAARPVAQACFADDRDVKVFNKLTRGRK